MSSLNIWELKEYKNYVWFEKCFNFIQFKKLYMNTNKNGSQVGYINSQFKFYIWNNIRWQSNKNNYYTFN